MHKKYFNIMWYMLNDIHISSISLLDYDYTQITILRKIIIKVKRE